ncbi:MAG: YdcF family protein [Pseudomonadota bacterium]
MAIIRYLLASTALAILAIGFGFVFFAKSVTASTDQIADPTSLVRQGSRTGLVVFTGGHDRIPSALKLLNRTEGARLLISGVNPDVTRQDLSELWSEVSTRFDCCVDLGKEATSTVGNATEAEGWVQSHQFDRIVVITSDYHMPRALLETKRRVTNIDVIGYPVDSSMAGGPKGGRQWRTMFLEYIKFLAASIGLTF